ncbi:hypothetical protein [Nitratireductor sp. StC3]|jgi:hypothetical protein|uniref:hypothetical protein n=1 Tax=Nitratireductor sp. StC3 TaxID=2126741 RepID=UPI001304B57C|nr:hypothetical protein [Nitratireductor sp. StC3]
MSIRDEINIAVNAGWLVNMQPTLPSIPHRRIILVSSSLQYELETELQDQATAHRAGLLLNTLDTFIGGGLITVGGRNDDAYIKLLEPEDRQVWEIRSVDPKPSIRVFGRFAEPNVFVATNKGFRRDLGAFGSAAFQRAMTDCTREWVKCFHTRPAHTGKRVNDFITENVVDLRDL